MKGSMLFSLITLCVVMLFMEERISNFLHGPSEPKGRDESSLPDTDFLSDWGKPLAGFWKDWSGFVTTAVGRIKDGPDKEKVVITEDTLQEIWVWRRDGAIQSARDKPAHPRARKVMIPEDMTAAEFFGSTGTQDTTGKTDPQPEETATTSGDEDSGSRHSGTPLDQLSPEQRRAMFDKGMDVLQQQAGSPDNRKPR